MRANDLFATITDQLIAAIEAGAGDWRMPWHTLADAGTPESVDGHRYRGVNALWLPMVSAANDWHSGVWATYRGWQRHGAQVRRGAKGTSVLLWKTLEPRTDDEPDEDGGNRRRLVARTLEQDAAAVGAQPAAQHGDQAGFAGAVAPGQRDHLTRGEAEAQALEDQPAATAASQILRKKARRGEGTWRQGRAAADACDHISFI